MDNIAIVGVAQTRFEARKAGQTNYEMVYEVTRTALDDAGYELEDIDNVVTVSNDFWDGRTISSMAIQEAAGAHDKNVSTVEGDGTFGALYGALRTLGGFKATLVVSHCKGSESDSRTVTNSMFDPIYQRSLGIDAIAAAALQARVYQERYGISAEQCAKVTIKNRANALNNPNAHLAGRLSLDDVMNSKNIASPLKLHDCSPVSDGAAAVIIADLKRARKPRNAPVNITGLGHCAEAYFLGDRDLANPIALRRAASRAYKLAGIKNPAVELDLIELYDAFSYMEPLWLEGLGICEPGGGARLLDEGITSMTGRLPVNPSGGVLSAHPVMVAGLARIIEAVLQLRGETGARQVKNAHRALAHGINGPCGQSHCVWVLENREGGN